MKKGFRIGLTIALAAITLLLFTITIYRWTWDYTENGTHFEEGSATTYSESAIIAYGVLTFIFLLPTLLLLKSFRKTSHRSQSF